MIRLREPHAEDVREVGQRVPADRESQDRAVVSLVGGRCYAERAGVDDRHERREPVLIQVLRAEVAEHGIREVGLHQLRSPGLPLGEVRAELVPTAALAGLEEQRPRGRRRPRPRVELRNRDLPPRERLVQGRQIADRDEEHGKAARRLPDLQGAAESALRVETRAGAEERRRAVVEVVAETGGLGGQGGIVRPEQTGEADDDPERPDRDVGDDPERAVEAEHRVLRRLGQPAGDRAPLTPGGPVEAAGEPGVALDAARKQEGDEELHEHRQDEQPSGDADDDPRDGHTAASSSSRETSAA